MTTEHPGHLFLVHGRIESVVHDAAIVPTDVGFSVRDYWEPLLGPNRSRHQPADWASVGYGRSSVEPSVWFIDVGDVAFYGLDTLMPRVRELLAAISRADLSPGTGRSRLRVAMPVLAISGGGMGSQRGLVLRELLNGLDRAAHEIGVDVVLVTPESSVYGGAQHLRRGLANWPLDNKHMAHARRLGQLARSGHLALFLGAGASVSAGLPTWNQLLTELTQLAGEGAPLSTLPPLDQAQLLQKRLGDDLGRLVAAITSRAERPSLAHALLAGMACHEVVTTNYDDLYEMAVRATGRPITSVLPWEPVTPGSPWVLKMHGDVRRPDKIVLTRRQFVRYDAATRPAGSILQALLLTKNLLIVGASLDDDNVSRLVHEVEAFRADSGLDGRIGTFLDVSDDEARRELWSDRLEWIDLSGQNIEERARSLEVFLDVVGAYASADNTWLLDERFAGLLSEEAQEATATARNLYQALPDSEEVAALRDVLRVLGVRNAEE